MNLTRCFSATLTCLLLTSCATTAPTKLAAPLAEPDKADHVVVVLGQSEIAVDDVDLQTGGQFGALGVLIEGIAEAKMSTNRQKAIAPLRDALLDYDFENRLSAALVSNLPTALVKSNAPIKIVRSEQEWQAHLATVVPSNVLRIEPRYALEQEFDIAYLHATSSLATFRRTPPSSSELKKMSQEQRRLASPTVLHSGAFYSEFVLRTPHGRQDKSPGQAAYELNASRWAVDSSEPLRTAFDRAVGEVAGLIKLDGDRQLQQAPVGATARALVASVITQPMFTKATLLQAAEGRSLISDGVATRWIDDRQIKSTSNR